MNAARTTKETRHVDDHALDACRRAVTEHNSKVESIRNDKTLSDLGRRQALHASYDSAKTTVDRVKAEQEATKETQRSALVRRLFGLPVSATATEVVAFRDAADRAARISDPQQLGEVMQRAADTGDKQLLKACAAHAFTQSRGLPSGRSEHFGLLVDEFAQHSATGGDLAEYRALLSTASRQKSLMEAMETTPYRPEEIRNERILSDEAPPPQKNANGFEIFAPTSDQAA